MTGGVRGVIIHQEQEELDFFVSNIGGEKEFAINSYVEAKLSTLESPINGRHQINVQRGNYR